MLRISFLIVLWALAGCEEAISPLEQGQPEAQYEEALSLYESKDLNDRQRGFYYLEQCAEVLPECAHSLATVFLHGIDMEPNPTRATAWLQRAAVADYKPAINDLAWFLVTTPDDHWYDPREAFRWLQTMLRLGELTAAEQDTAAAIFAANGDFRMAVRYQTEAIELARNDDFDARELRGFELRLEAYQRSQCFRANRECTPIRNSHNNSVYL
ncbi:SEL1-like repeat protein [Umboniibacter marinipuniceus]|uniref:Sel1 repeat-containing protein n=1 Tax=Umboniibacter marinipuniceus TaxID=569599 RepID=A0A3M0A5X6_9GAMM|nr:SEL1-like repeat protein [Umboniibacter marinipuniceus]RMA80180.1 Sel1 repeat-containing protein [Umboniibacter marinipuniceus]